MRQIIIILSLLLIVQISYGQDKSKLTFETVVKDGVSTAPDFVVLTIKNLNNNQTKELITDVISLYEAFKKELNQPDYDKIRDYLLSNSQNQKFELRNKEALERLNFTNYELKSSDKIKQLFDNKNLVDSLEKINIQREIVSEKFYEYSDQREEAIEKIKDSIIVSRNLTTEEVKMLGDLTDQYYDYHYNEYAKTSEQGKQLMKIWNAKIKPYKDNYKKYTDELERLEQKFFRNYIEKYGLSFCHVAFKYGVIINSNCENGQLEFNQIIK